MIHEHSNLMNMREREIFNRAIDSIQAITDITVQDVFFEEQERDNGYDGWLHINYGKDLTMFRFNIKGEVRTTDNLMPVSKRSQPGQYLLISQYIPKPVKEQLKQADINYLEASGNCFIKTDRIYLYINDQPVTQMRLPAEGKLWNTAGLKFLFIMLLQPDILNSSYRQIADAADIALGSVGPLISELEKEGFLIERQVNGEKASIVEGREKLLQRWAGAYCNTLKPKLLKGTFRFANQKGIEGWQDIPAKDFIWGGEAAGAKLTGYLVPNRLSLYTKEDKFALMKKLRLIPDENGPVEMMTQFWEDRNVTQNTLGTVPPLLAYAELWNSFDSRNQETAERIKNKYLDE